MSCKLCAKRGKTWQGADPRCAFEHSDTAAHNNWRCATIEALWALADKNGDLQYGEDCTAALIPVYGTGYRFIVLSSYKRRGQTDCAQVITGDGEIVRLTLRTAEWVLGEPEQEEEEPLPLVSYAAWIPESVEMARAILDGITNSDCAFNDFSREGFLLVWCAVVYLNPGLHPDDCDEWPEDIQKVAIEAFRRRNIGELTDEELYPALAISARLAVERKVASCTDQ